jgi:hypothetical protein
MESLKQLPLSKNCANNDLINAVPLPQNNPPSLPGQHRLPRKMISGRGTVIVAQGLALLNEVRLG